MVPGGGLRVRALAGALRRWYPTLMTLPSGNVLIVGGNLVANGGGGTPSSQNPTYQILNSATAALGYKILLPTNLLQTVVPYALYPLIFQLPRTQSILVRAHRHVPHASAEKICACVARNSPHDAWRLCERRSCPGTWWRCCS